jgi:hypothetical protein
VVSAASALPFPDRALLRYRREAAPHRASDRASPRCGRDRRHNTARAELLRDVQKAVGLHGPCQRHPQAGEQSVFGQSADCGLVAGVALKMGLLEHSVSPAHVAAQEHAVPRNEHVVEHRHGVRLFEARAQRMIPFGLATFIEGLPTNETKSGRVSGTQMSELGRSRDLPSRS